PISKKMLVPPSVTQLPPPKTKHSFHSASVLVFEATKFRGFELVGASFHPSINCVPPTAVTRGLTAGKPTAVVDRMALSLCCLAEPPFPSSPDDARNVSPLSM